MTKRRKREVPSPTEAEIDEVVSAAMRTRCWNNLAATLRRYGRRLGLPPEIVLLDSMIRRMLSQVSRHPEQWPLLLADIQATDKAAAEAAPAIPCSVEQAVENLKTQRGSACHQFIEPLMYGHVRDHPLSKLSLTHVSSQLADIASA